MTRRNLKHMKDVSSNSKHFGPADIFKMVRGTMSENRAQVTKMLVICEFEREDGATTRGDYCCGVSKSEYVEMLHRALHREMASHE